MADAVTVRTLFDGPREKVVRLTSLSDGTGEAAVNKITIANFLFGALMNKVPDYIAIDRIEYRIQGFPSVKLHWNHTTPDLIAALPAGEGSVEGFDQFGGLVDPKSAGGTGNVALTSPAGATTGTYDITIYFRGKLN